MSPLRSLLIAPLAAAALAAPAGAAPTLHAVVAAHLGGTASGTDGDGWTSSSTFSTALGADVSGIADPGTDAPINADTPAPLVTDTTLHQDYALVTDLQTITWSCAPDGEATAAPGSISIQHSGDAGTVSMYLSQTLTANRSCSGFSTFSTSIDVAGEPVTIPPTSFSWNDLVANGSVAIPINRVVKCGEWSIHQTACDLRLTGTLVLLRSDADADATPTPTPTGTQPAETGDEVTSPPRPATPIRAKGALIKHGKGAKVKVRCAAACSGRVTAKAGARRIGATSFSSSGGTTSVTVMFGRGGRAAAQHHGSVLFDVSASGQTTRFRLKD